MPPKAADKKPAASKAPATASKAPEKKDAGKKTAASGDKKKRTKARKETYSSYIYKGKQYHCATARFCFSTANSGCFGALYSGEIAPCYMTRLDLAM